MDSQTRFTTEALVIKETEIGESDRLVTLFTRDYGVIKAFASGAKNIRSKKAAATSLLTYSSFTILKRKETFRIYEAVPLNIFFGAGSSIEVLSLCQYFCELCNEFAPEGVSSSEFFRLILNSIHFVTKEKRNPTLIKAITELRIAVIAGYMPDLLCCKKCGKYEDDIMYFNIREGNIYCKDCKNIGELISINSTELYSIRHIVYSEFKKLYSFEIPDENAKKISDLSERYLTYQTDHHFKTLDFYNSIKE